MHLSRKKRGKWPEEKKKKSCTFFFSEKPPTVRRKGGYKGSLPEQGEPAVDTKNCHNPFCGKRMTKTHFWKKKRGKGFSSGEGRGKNRRAYWGGDKKTKENWDKSLNNVQEVDLRPGPIQRKKSRCPE